MRARAHIEELRGGRTAVIVTELPYAVKKGGDDGVISKVAELVKDGVLTEIADLKDLSDKSRHADRDPPQARRRAAGRAEQALQAHRAADDVRLQRGRARRRRAAHARPARSPLALPRAPARSRHAPLKYELRKAEARAHVLEGYLIALDNLDEVIALIRAAADTDEARDGS